MKILFASDLHGNDAQIRLLQSYIAQHDIDAFIFAGDLAPVRAVYNGPLNADVYIRRILFPTIISFKCKYKIVIPGNTDFRWCFRTYVKEFTDPRVLLVTTSAIVTLEGLSILLYPYVPLSTHMLKDYERPDIVPESSMQFNTDTIISRCQPLQSKHGSASIFRSILSKHRKIDVQKLRKNGYLYMMLRDCIPYDTLQYHIIQRDNVSALPPSFVAANEDVISAIKQDYLAATNLRAISLLRTGKAEGSTSSDTDQSFNVLYADIHLMEEISQNPSMKSCPCMRPSENCIPRWFVCQANTTIYDDLLRILATAPYCPLWVTHAPIYGTNADALRGDKHVGSRAMRRIIEERPELAPILSVSGHIHETIGASKAPILEQTIGTSTVTVCPMGNDGIFPPRCEKMNFIVADIVTTADASPPSYRASCTHYTLPVELYADHAAARKNYHLFSSVADDLYMKDCDLVEFENCLSSP